MGKNGIHEAMENTLCADYIKSILEGQLMDFDKIYEDLLESGAAKEFMDPNCDWMPQTDFEFCLNLNKFHFVLKAEEFKNGLMFLKKR